MALKIYTKTGDKGKTGLIGGTRVLKDDVRIESYGTVDELNSYIGLIKDLLETETNVVKMLQEIQDRLFTIGSALACDPEKEPRFAIPDLRETDVQALEAAIDNMNGVLPPMRFFILPGGHTTLSHLHIARCVCRRAERRCVTLKSCDPSVEPLIITYLNRLSDYLFVLCRYVGRQLSIKEVEWHPRIS